MLFFKNDYGLGAHEKVWEALLKHRDEFHSGYGTDDHTRELQAMIQKRCRREDAKVHVVAGGTQANMLVISHGLRPYEAVLAVDTGHINVHETGAVEGTGHKILTVEGVDGKMTAEAVSRMVAVHGDEHMVKPAMVYISQTTEVGTVYSGEELRSLSEACRRHELKLFIDGARLASAMAARPEVDFALLAQVADGFTVGGTKNGALFGEAIVLLDPTWQREFRYAIKHRGAMSAKGYIGAMMMKALLEDGLYESIGCHSNEMAKRIADAAGSLGLPFAYPPMSNQIFLQLKEDVAELLEKKTGAERIASVDGQAVMRLVTCFGTKEDDVKELVALLQVIAN